MSARDTLAAASELPAPRFSYHALDAPLPERVLLAVSFGDAPVAGPHGVRIPLTPLAGAGLRELWHACGPVTCGREGLVRYSTDGVHLAGVIEIDEREHGGLAAAAQAAYAEIGRFQSLSGYAHLLRIWNYLDAINHGTGDTERYRQFCIGRAAGLMLAPGSGHAAATAIGRRDASPLLQVYWLAGRRPGLALENPRQVSAYRYPRQYGPAAPRFSRAMLVPGPLLMVSGTASIVGHASRHSGNVRGQLLETLANLQSIQQRAFATAPGLAQRPGAASLLKAYLRERSALSELVQLVAERLPDVPVLVLEADICRSELLVEIDCIC
ncbi:MAG TPA: hypothetical protein VME21_09790 [Steroidobacteraceae bacterium]|nr:hypothetical protein [Steroidobacteraceae bacterium]